MSAYDIEERLRSTICFGVPLHNHNGILRYILYGIEPGGFVCAVIDNDLKECFMRGDEENLSNLRGIVSWFYNHAPEMCWGSPERRKRWQESLGLNGLIEASNKDQV